MTRTWVRISREVLGERGDGLPYHDDTAPDGQMRTVQSTRLQPRPLEAAPPRRSRRMIDDVPPLQADRPRQMTGVAVGAARRGNAFLDPRSEPPDDITDLIRRRR